MKKFALLSGVFLVAVALGSASFMFGSKSASVTDSGNEAYQSCVLRGKGNEGEFCMQCLQGACMEDADGAWEKCVSEGVCD